MNTSSELWSMPWHAYLKVVANTVHGSIGHEASRCATGWVAPLRRESTAEGKFFSKAVRAPSATVPVKSWLGKARSRSGAVRTPTR